MKGIVITINYNSKLKMTAGIKVLYVLKWVCFGIFYLLFIYVRDIVFCFISVFIVADKKISDLKMFQKNITEEDVIIFLKFIHSKINCGNKKDFHALFMQYIEFENNEKLQLKENLKKKKEYLKKIRKWVLNAEKIKEKSKNWKFKNYFLSLIRI